MSRISVELELKDGSFATGMLRAGQSVKSFQNELARLDKNFADQRQSGGNYIRNIEVLGDKSKSLSRTFRDASVGFAAFTLALQSFAGTGGNVISQITSINAEMERLTYQMIGMSTAAGPLSAAVTEAGKSVDYLKSMVKTVPFSLTQLSSTFVKLKSAGIDPTAGAMQSLADGVAAMGGTDEQLQRVTLGISQMYGKSVIQMEEMRQQLGESMPNAMKLMARSMGMSVAELTKAIATGTLDAKSSLNSFYDELERTYGGSAQRMMGTFSGQLAQVKANLQLLAQSDGMKAFFNQQKESMEALNSFLSAASTGQFSTSLGHNMAKIAQAVSVVISKVWDLRGTLTMLLGGFVALKGIGLATSLLDRFSMSMQTTRLRTAAYSSMLKIAGSELRDFSQFIQLSGTRMQAAQRGISGLMRAGTAMVGMFSAWAPAIALAGLAAYKLGQHFGVFKTDVQEVNDAVVSMGANSRAQAQETLDGNFKNLGTDKLWAYMKFYGAMAAHAPQLYGAEDLEAALKRINDQANELQEKTPAYMAASLLNESKAEMQTAQNLIADSLQNIQKGYRDAQEQVEQTRSQALADAKTTGASVTQIENRAKADRFRVMMEAEREKQKLYEDTLAHYREIQAAASDDDKVRYNALILDLQERLAEVRTNMNQIGEEAQFLKGPVSPEKAAAAGGKVLEQLRDKLVDLRAEASGGAGDVAKLQAQIARGEFGNIEDGGLAFQNLARDILGAATELEQLERLVKSQTDLKNAFENADEKIKGLRRENDERERGRPFTEGEKILEDLNSGKYFGFGPNDTLSVAIDGVNAKVMSTGTTLSAVGEVARNDTFGNETVTHIQTTGSEVDALKEKIVSLQQAVSGIDFRSAFSGLGEVGAGPLGGPMDAAGAKSFLDLIGMAEGTDKGRKYDEVLGYGAYGEGNLPISKMNMMQVYYAGRRILNHPDNKFNSSAMGRYQITGTTMLEMASQMGLDPYTTTFSPEIQDQMAMRLMARRGANIGGLRQEWQGLNRVSDADIMRLYNGAARPGPTNFAAAGVTAFQAPAAAAPQLGPVSTPQNEAQAALSAAQASLAAAQENAATIAAQSQQRLADARVEAQARVDAENTEIARGFALDRKDLVEELGRKISDPETYASDNNERDTLNKIREGSLGESRDISAPEYERIIQLAKDADAAYKSLKDTQERTREVERGRERIGEQLADVQERIAEASQRAKDPNYVENSRALQKLNNDLKQHLALVAQLHGKDSQEYRDAEAQANALLGGQRTADALDLRGKLGARVAELTQSTKAETDVRRAALQRDLAMVDQWVSKAREAGMAEVDITRQAESDKAAIRQAYADQDPMTAQFKQWGDMQSNLEREVTSWSQTAAEQVKGIFTGATDGDSIRSTLGGIADNMLSLGINKMFSNIGTSKGKSAAGTAGPLNGFMKRIGIAHSGAVVGSHKNTSPRPASLWNNAPRFHKGGIPASLGPKLLPSEVPIIAQKGEGIFTPDQMEHLGGFQQNQAVSYAPNITVTGAGGTPEQNDHMAKAIARETEASFRSIIRDEIGRQSRPGAMLNRGRGSL